ncbi:hypothetical protein B296_00029794 [Ensete ventricosum]|uniref:Uncharacterized protein n=1 Tax=Ensete ventricosum TaxID=4639 RepID=A0A426XGT2_ENSVE|nr:hypothetical protein B296_00029794 [Ensete ventricosum]
MRGARGDEEGARGMRCAPSFLGEKDELAVGETAKGALIYQRGGGVGGGDAGLFNFALFESRTKACR